MAKHRFDPHDSDFADETRLLRGANTLPALSNRLRERVLNAATTAYRQARRWAQARQAASFLSVCLLASFVLSPLANSSMTDSVWERFHHSSDSSYEVVSLDRLSSPQQPSSAWTLSHDRAFLDLPLPRVAKPQTVNPEPSTHNPRSRLIAHSDLPPPRDKLLTALHSSDGWGTVNAFQAVRSRSQSTLQRAFAAN